MLLYRHGDVLLMSVASIPLKAEKRRDLVLAEDGQTGKAYQVADAGAAELFQHGDLLYLRVDAPCVQLVHPEHRTIAIPGGVYRVWQHREFVLEPRQVVH